jgi:serine/threonine-protein kinase
MVMGTADYIAPEQATACSRADHRADIYSLGATLYHLVTGEPPFHGTLAAKLIAHQLHDVPTAHEVREDVPEQLSEVIAHMMAKEPADRYQSAVEAATALHHCMENTPFVAETPSGKLVSTGTKSAEEVLIVVHDDHAKKLIAIAVVLAVAIICVVAATILMM